MLEPTRYAVLDDPVYGPVPVSPDRTRVSEDSDLARLYPGLWRQAPGRVGEGSRERIYSSGAGDRMTIETVTGRERVAAPTFTREAGSSVQLVAEPRAIKRGHLIGGGQRVSLLHRSQPTGLIRLSDSARDMISAEVAAGGPAETGGGLYGSVTDLIAASGPGPLAERGRSSLRLDRDHLDAEAKRVAAPLVGVWHSHPVESPRNHLPSGADLDVFDHWRHDARLAEFAALIVTPTTDGAWTVTAWRIAGSSARPLSVWGI